MSSSSSSTHTPLPKPIIQRIQKAVTEYQNAYSTRKSLISAVGFAQHWINEAQTSVRSIDNPEFLVDFNVFVADKWKGSKEDKLLYTASIYSFDWRSYLSLESEPIPACKEFDVLEPGALVDVIRAHKVMVNAGHNFKFNAVELIQPGANLVSWGGEPCWIFFSFNDTAPAVAVGARTETVTSLGDADKAAWLSVSCSRIDHYTGWVPATDSALKIAKHSFPESTVSLVQFSTIQNEGATSDYCIINVGSQAHIVFRSKDGPNWAGWEPFIYHPDGNYDPSTLQSFHWDPTTAKSVQDAASLAGQKGFEFIWNSYEVSQPTSGFWKDRGPSFVFVPEEPKKWNTVEVGLYQDIVTVNGGQDDPIPPKKRDDDDGLGDIPRDDFGQGPGCVRPRFPWQKQKGKGGLL